MAHWEGVCLHAFRTPILGRYPLDPPQTASPDPARVLFYQLDNAGRRRAVDEQDEHHVHRVQPADVDVEHVRGQLDLGKATACELRSLPQILSLRGPPLRRRCHKYCPSSCIPVFIRERFSRERLLSIALAALSKYKADDVSDSFVSIQRLLPLPRACRHR